MFPLAHDLCFPLSIQNAIGLKENIFKVLGVGKLVLGIGRPGR